jgi:hypothetical protein
MPFRVANSDAAPRGGEEDEVDDWEPLVLGVELDECRKRCTHLLLPGEKLNASPLRLTNSPSANPSPFI